MHCREFRNKHVAFVDDLLPAIEMDAMRQHLNACCGCARRDFQVRRSLLLVRNLPPIEASPEFMERLNARIARLQPLCRDEVIRSHASLASAATFAALAAGIIAIAYFTVETNNYFTQPGAMEPSARVVAAMQPFQIDASPISNAALVAAVPTGIPVWPAVLMAGQTPMRFATLEFADEAEAR